MIPHSNLELVWISGGMGDGGYAAFWRINSQNQPVALMFDFAATLATWGWEEINVALDWNDDEVLISTPRLRFELSAVNDQVEFRIAGGSSVSAKILDENGQIVFETESAASSICQNVRSYIIGAAFPERFQGSIIAKTYLGHGYVVHKS